MIYRFRSPATDELVMLGSNGDELLRILGRAPAASGIIEPAAMPAAIEALQAAAAACPAAQAGAGDQGHAGDEDGEGDADAAAARQVSLRQRVWPMVEMLRRAQAAGAPVVWGV